MTSLVTIAFQTSTIATNLYTLNSTADLWPDFSNYTNTTTCTPRKPPNLNMIIVRNLVSTIFPIIFIIGVFGNGVLILIFMSQRNFRNVANTLYIINLAVADLILIIFSVPFTSVYYLTESWPFSETICKMQEFVKDLSLGLSVFTLTALSADRFLGIALPFKTAGGSRARSYTKIVIGFIWLIAILCSSPAAFFANVKVMPNETCPWYIVCHTYSYEKLPKSPKYMSLIKFLLYYFIPLIIIAIFNRMTAQHVLRSTTNLPVSRLKCRGNGQVEKIPYYLPSDQQQIQRRRKAAKIVLTLVCVFALSFLPYHFFALWFYYYPNAQNDFNAFWNTFKAISFILYFANSCINPIALYIVSQSFRKHFYKYMNHFLGRTTPKSGGKSTQTTNSKNRCCRNRTLKTQSDVAMTPITNCTPANSRIYKTHKSPQSGDGDADYTFDDVASNPETIALESIKMSSQQNVRQKNDESSRKKEFSWKINESV